MDRQALHSSMLAEAEQFELDWSLPWYTTPTASRLWGHDTLKALLSMDDDTFLEMGRTLLSESSFALRAIAVHIASIRKTRELLPEIRNLLLQDESNQVRAIAAASMSTLGMEEESIDAFLGISDDEHPEVKKTVIVGLRACRNDKAVSIIARWANRAGEDEAVKVASAVALGEIGGDTSRDALITLIEDRNEADGPRTAAADGLGEIACEKSVATLQKACSDERSWVRAKALLALGKLRNRNFDGLLLDATATVEPWMVRAHAAEALGHCDTGESLERLQELVKDQEIRIRSEACASLGRRSSRESLPSLREALDDPEILVRVQAVHAISRITGQSFGLEDQTNRESLDPQAVLAAIARAKEDSS